jgi:clan AA aspartic protease
MITGLVTSNREAVICVLVRGPQGKGTQIEAIIDTGFNGFLTLPPQFIADLALPFAGTTRAALGDGSEVQMDVFEATVLWDNQERSVVSLGAEGGALLGMSMLSGYRITLDVKDGGTVIIEVLS